MPTRPVDSRFATGTARVGPSTCRAAASSPLTLPWPEVRATSIGHAGILIESAAGSILCDPWFEPAFFASWFVFPRNDRLDADLLDRIERADFLYVSHLHGDHHDESWLRRNLSRDIPVLLPDYPTGEQRRRMEALGFTTFLPTTDGVEVEIAPGLTVAVHVETSITDGPGGDSALVVSDGESRIVNQNDCRTTDLAALASHGPVDLHWLQYSGAIWYPMVYEMPADEKLELCRAKVESQGARAMRYVESIGARAVVPSAGPPVFLDDELAHLNMIEGDEASIFPDQRWFLDRLSAGGHTGVLAVPGTTIEVSPSAIDVRHPMEDTEIDAIFSDKAAYLDAYLADWADWIGEQRASWSRPGTDLVGALADWWVPLMESAPTVCAAIGAPCVIRTDDLEILIDFPNAKVLDASEHPGAAPGFRFDIGRDLLETVVAERAVDWSNSLLLSCRFTAWRAGDYNEYLYNFLKSLSVERMRRTEAEAASKRRGDGDDLSDEVEIGDFIVQRKCPHRRADLSVFGEIDGDDLVCTLHGWRFDTTTGECRTSGDHPLRIRRSNDAPTA